MGPILAAYNQSQLLFLGNWGPRWLIAFTIVALAVVVLTWFDLREMRPSRRYTLLVLRAVVLALGIFFAAEPALELREVTRAPNHIAVLFDGSASGTLPADGTHTRQQVLQNQAKALDTHADPERHIFDLFRFGDHLKPTTQSALEGLQSSDQKTDILGALQAIHTQYAPDTLGGIVLLSDGQDNATLSGRVSADDPLDENTLSLLKRLGVPIHTVQIAQDKTIKDVAIRHIYHDDFAFVRNATTIKAKITVHGYKSGHFPVRLRRNGKILQTKTLAIQKDTSDYELTFKFVPELLGKEIYSLDIPVEKDDAVPENNREFFVVNVIRDKIRVLQVVGRPSWDVRFLRHLLKNDPNVDLVSFFILRGFNNVYRAPENEMSLIPFPTRELFEEQLGSFDLVILQDFAYGPFGVGQYLKNIRDYVKRGGGLLMIGGDGGFSTGGYANTPIEQVLPVKLGRASDPKTSVDLRKFRPQLTEAGKRHPITRLELDPHKNAALWKELPKLHGTNVVGAAKPGAVVLATHPSLRAGGKPMPVIAIADEDKGRSMALTADSIWRWNYQWMLEGGSSQPYSSLWNSAIRWLIRDPALSLVQLSIGQSIVHKGNEVQIDVRAFNADYSPAANTPIQLTLEHRSLDDLIEGKNIKHVDEQISLKTDDRGQLRWTVKADQQAAWKVTAKMDISDDIHATATEVFLSTHHSPELRDVEPRDDLLQKLSKATDGTFSRAGQRTLTHLPFKPPQIQRVDRHKSINVWSAPWILLIFVLLLGLEWQLRRRWGRL